MRRRDFIGGLGSAAAWPVVARAQQRERMRRIGVLAAFDESDVQGQRLIKAFRTGLTERGWIEGRNAEVQVRYAQERSDRLLVLASELIGAKVEVVVTHGTPAVQAAQKASDTIPIVFATIGDPVGAKIVASLSRPGGRWQAQQFPFRFTSLEANQKLPMVVRHFTDHAALQAAQG